MELKLTDKDQVLIVAPHPDDETIGCGGLLARYGAQCSVLLMTDGRLGAPSDYDGKEDICAVRKRELQNALQEAGTDRLFCLDAPDGNLKKQHRGLHEIDLKRYTYVFAPNPWENHDDHRAAYDLIKKELKRQRSKAKLMQYEVWTTLREPDYYLDITQQIEVKRRMIAHYTSQLKDKDYMGAAIGLNVYRGMWPGYTYAEAYSSCGWKHTLWAYYSRLSPECKTRIRKLLHR